MHPVVFGRDGEIEVAGPHLGHGTPYFAGPRTRLRLVASDLITEDVIRLTYVPA